MNIIPNSAGQALMDLNAGTCDIAGVSCDPNSIQLPNIQTPTNLSVSKGTYPNEITLSWNAVPNAVGYYIYRNTTNTIPSSRYDTHLSPSFIDTKVDYDQCYYYWIQAYDSTGGLSYLSQPDYGFLYYWHSIYSDSNIYYNGLYNYNLHAGEDAAFIGRGLEKTDHEWDFEYNITGGEYTTFYYGNHNNTASSNDLNQVKIQVTKDANSNAVFMLRGSNDWYGSEAANSHNIEVTSGAPFSNNELMKACFDFAMSWIDNTVFQGMYSTFNFLDTLLNCCSGSTDQHGSQIMNWNYDNYYGSSIIGACEAKQFFHFEVAIQANQQASFTTDLIVNGGLDPNSGYHLGPNPLPIPAVPDPTQMTQSQMQQYGVEAIPIIQATSEAAKLGFSADTVNQLQTSGEIVVYVVHNPFGITN